MRRRAAPAPVFQWSALTLAQRMSFAFGWAPSAPSVPRAIAAAWPHYASLLDAYRAVRHELPPDAPALRPTAFASQLAAAVRRAPRRDVETIGRELWHARYPL